MRYPKPHTKFTDDGRLKLEDRYVLHIALLNEYVMMIPREFIWDGASIPRIFWFLVGHPLNGKVIVPSLVHDWLCERAATYSERILADAIFFYLLSCQGVPYWRRALMYAAVRFWGRLTYWRRL